MLRNFSDTSVVIFTFKCIYRWHNQIEQRLIEIHYNSQTHRLTKIFLEKIKICFRYSFLGRITEIKQTNPVILDNSQAVQCLINFYKRRKDKLIQCLRTSSTTGLAKDIKKEVYFSPARIISLIVVTTVVVNVALSFILQKQIDLRGWLIRGLFLFAGVAGLFCKADWSTVKSDSVFLRKSGWFRDG